jgi:dolichyl-phosphate beta-glucosyltransferase
MKLEVSIIIPAYNEEARLGETLHQIIDYLRSAGSTSEVIVVDDGSTDATSQVAEEAFRAAGPIAARVIRNQPNRGKGHAVRTGLLAALAPVAVFSDADLSTPITELPKVIGPIQAGTFDVVFGSRALDRTLIGVHQTWRREQGGRVYNALVRIATGLPFSDTQCGFKAFRMPFCRSIVEEAEIDGFGFDVELIYLAHLAGMRISEVPVRWSHCDGSKISFLSDSLRMLREVVGMRRQIRERRRSGRQGAAQVPDTALNGIRGPF